MCPAGTERAGHFYGSHMGNWQHAAMYPAFILAGVAQRRRVHVAVTRSSPCRSRDLRGHVSPCPAAACCRESVKYVPLCQSPKELANVEWSCTAASL